MLDFQFFPISFSFSFLILVNTTKLKILYSNKDARTAFVNGQPLPPDDTSGPRPCNDEWPVLALTYDFGQGKRKKQREEEK